MSAGVGGALLGTLGGSNIVSSGSGMLSVISTEPISRVAFDEDAAEVDIVVADFARDDAVRNDSDADGRTGAGLRARKPGASPAA